MTKYSAFQTNLPTDIIADFDNKLRSEGKTRQWFITTIIGAYLTGDLNPQHLITVKNIDDRISLLESRLEDLENLSSDKNYEYIKKIDIPLTNIEKYALSKLISRKEITGSVLRNINRSRFKDVESATLVLISLEYKGLVTHVETKKGFKVKLTPYGHSCLFGES